MRLFGTNQRVFEDLKSIRKISSLVLIGLVAFIVVLDLVSQIKKYESWSHKMHRNYNSKKKLRSMRVGVKTVRNI